MRKIIVALCLAAAFIYAVPMGANAAITQDTDGYYKLSTSSDLKEFKEFVDKGYLIANAKLMNDIVLSDDQNPCDWTEVGPIGPSSSREYLGTIDGKGFAIKGLYLDSKTSDTGLVGRLGTTGIIKNLTIYGTVKSTKTDTGAFAGNCYGKILNCTNYAAISTDAGLAGGIAGIVSSADDSAGSIVNCFNKGNVSAVGGAAAGITGALSKGCTVKNCVNTGSVTSTSSDGFGGIVGNATDGSFILNCFNTGDVTSSTPGSKWGGANNIGGIVGSASSNATIKNCVSSGNVIGIPNPTDTNNRTGRYIGGVVGSNKGAAVTDCYWLKDSAISADHGIGGDGSYTVGTDEGTVSSDKKESFPVVSIILDTYAKAGHTFKITATAYPAESSQAGTLTVKTADGLTLTPDSLKNADETTLTASGEAGKEYDASVSASDGAASVDFTVVPEDEAVTPSDEGTGARSGSNGGCSAGFGALGLLAIIPLALYRKKK